MSARRILAELKRRLRERAIPAGLVSDSTELDFALIERIYEIAPQPARVTVRPPR